jgi:hypothetical protein
MKLSELIEINAELNKALDAYQNHRGRDASVEEYDSIAIPLAKIVGKTNALIWIHSHNIELEVE